ncbi:MFS transporter [uncultured Limosilactobacillus sp.]|uniref:MFS transporter n=1 Tax=uncultured Limosilactobacillus sp. TaxID=2837629 RepID=UPI0025F1BED9|nr:MFS transporter [uncultured Limosilactobacillus sp.]
MDDQSTVPNLVKKYQPLAIAAGFGSILGSGIIVGMSATITVWQLGLHLTNGQVGVISGSLTFVIAVGSLLAGWVTKTFGLARSFNWMNFIYAIGALICVCAPNYVTLLGGAIVTGLASGLDLPISLTMISHDAPDDQTSSKLVASTQIFWQVGVFASYGAAFIVSKMAGASGARVVFACLAIFALIIWAWRTFSKKFKIFHAEGDQRQKAQQHGQTDVAKISVKEVLFGKKRSMYLRMFICIIVFYCCWNILANTFGQFQTFMLVQAHASQTFATGAGLVLNFISLFAAMAFAKAAGSPSRNKFYVIGMIIQFVGMFSLVVLRHDLWPIVIAIGITSIGSNIAGEAIYKVWTQEAFPVAVRSSIQGFIGGFSRFLCGVFAFVTPVLVVQSVIKKTMVGFSIMILVAFAFGLAMIRLEKHYKIGQ